MTFKKKISLITVLAFALASKTIASDGQPVAEDTANTLTPIPAAALPALEEVINDNNDACSSEESAEIISAQQEPLSRDELFGKLFGKKPTRACFNYQSPFDGYLMSLSCTRDKLVEKLKSKAITIGLKQLMNDAANQFNRSLDEKSPIHAAQIQGNYTAEDLDSIIQNLFALQKTYALAVRRLPTLKMDDLACLEIADLNQIQKACSLSNEIEFFVSLLNKQDVAKGKSQDEESQSIMHTAEDKKDMMKSLSGMDPKGKIKTSKQDRPKSIKSAGNELFEIR